MKKKACSIIMSVLMLMSMAFNTYAMAIPGDDSISPYWTNMSTVNIDVDFGDDNVGNASVMISKVPGVTTSIEASLDVYYKSGSRWIYVDGTSGDNSGSLYLEVEFNAVSGREYKVVVDIIAYSGSSSETESLSEIYVCP